MGTTLAELSFASDSDSAQANRDATQNVFSTSSLLLDLPVSDSLENSMADRDHTARVTLASSIQGGVNSLQHLTASNCVDLCSFRTIFSCPSSSIPTLQNDS